MKKELREEQVKKHNEWLKKIKRRNESYKNKLPSERLSILIKLRDNYIKENPNHSQISKINEQIAGYK